MTLAEPLISSPVGVIAGEVLGEIVVVKVDLSGGWSDDDTDSIYAQMKYRIQDEDPEMLWQQ